MNINSQVEAGDPGLWSEPPSEVPAADPHAVARKILLDQLTGRARSRHELALKLASKNVPGEIAGGLLDRFEEVGLIDDLAFARLWVNSRQQTRGLTRRVLAMELRRKGVNDEVIAQALEDVAADDEESSARALVRKKLPTLGRVDQVTATRRLIGQLARKGHSPGLAARIVREELSAVAETNSSAELLETSHCDSHSA
jgi:regulatory protein